LHQFDGILHSVTSMILLQLKIILSRQLISKKYYTSYLKQSAPSLTL